MNITFTRKNVNGRFVNYFETETFLVGFTEWDFGMDNLASHFKPRRLVELEQIHSNIIHDAGDIQPGTEGDGLITETPGLMMVIETADCTPLFFWHPDGSIGGVIHIGWRGLFQGIEKKLVELLIGKNINLSHLQFFLGPAVEQDCYEVGPELFDQFSVKSYGNKIFSPSPRENDPRENEMKYFMDVKKGIALSLRESGIPSGHIADVGLCTYCEAGRFPSYRRQKGTGQRIDNFLQLK